MKNLVGKIGTIGFAVVAIVTVLGIGSCRDKFITQVDTLIVHDTAVRQVVTHDTIDLDDSSVWVYRKSNTANNLVVTQFVNSNGGFIGGDNGIVLSSVDAGSDWTIANANIGTTGIGGNVVYGLAFLDPMHGFAVGDGQSVYNTNDGGKSWSQTSSNSGLFLRTICFTDPNTGFIGTSDPTNNGNGAGQDGEILVTHDGGNTWSVGYSSPTGGIYNVRFITPSNGIAMGRQGTALWTSDGGTTWQPGMTDQPTATIFKTAFTSATTGFAASYIDDTHGAILRTDDAGHSWRTVRLVPFGMSGLASNTKGVITGCGYSGFVTESTDGGVTWKDSKVGPDRWVDIAYINADRTIMVGLNGNIVTRDK